MSVIQPLPKTLKENAEFLAGRRQLKFTPLKTYIAIHLEWLQFRRFRDNLVITLDSNRNAFVFIDVVTQKRIQVRYDSNWAL